MFFYVPPWCGSTQPSAPVIRLPISAPRSAHDVEVNATVTSAQAWTCVQNKGVEAGLAVNEKRVYFSFHGRNTASF